MIFWLEVDGKLRKCEVFEPYAGIMATLNALRGSIKNDPEAVELAKDSVRSAARNVVELGQYRIID